MANAFQSQSQSYSPSPSAANQPETSTARWQSAAWLALIVAVCLRNAWSTLDRYFLSDDFAYVARFHALPWREWPGLFIGDWSGGIWGSTLPELRPFAALTFLWDAHWWGVNPLGYHLTNFALDAGCAVLVALIGRHVLRLPKWAGAAAAAVFACHPAHAEPVAWITGRVDLLGTLAYLGGFYAAARSMDSARPGRWVALAVGTYFVGCFSKEFCLTMPLMFGAWLVVYRPPGFNGATRARWGLLGGFVAVVVIYALCRQHAFGGGRASSHGLAWFSPAWAERQMDYLRWYLTPLYNWGRDHRPELAAAPWQFIGVVAAVVLGGLALAHRYFPSARTGWRAVLFFGVTWYLVATLPMAVASYFSPRHLYLSTAGLGLAFAAVVAHAIRWRIAAALVASWAVIFSAQCFDQAASAWRHSAKVSERVTAAVVAESTARPDFALILDVPQYYEGVGMWAWATPFALEPPFTSASPAVVIEAPLVYFNPEAWLRPKLFAQLAQAPGATLISLDARGYAVVQQVDASRWPSATSVLPTERGASGVAGYEAAWHEFLLALRQP